MMSEVDNEFANLIVTATLYYLFYYRLYVAVNMFEIYLFHFMYYLL